MQKNLVKKSKEDKAEEIVARWYSLTRNRSIEEPNVLKILKINIAQALLSSGHSPLTANDIATKVIIEWGQECEGLAVNRLEVMEVLQVRITQVI